MSTSWTRHGSHRRSAQTDLVANGPLATDFNRPSAQSTIPHVAVEERLYVRADVLQITFNAVGLAQHLDQPPRSARLDFGLTLGPEARLPVQRDLDQIVRRRREQSDLLSHWLAGGEDKG